MPVVVRGLIMPYDCKECKVSCETESGLHCLLVDDGNKLGWKKIESRGRPDWCPLRPLPEKHGRLIDADEATRGSLERTGKRLLAIDTAPTIVEAEGD